MSRKTPPFGHTGGQGSGPGVPEPLPADEPSGALFPPDEPTAVLGDQALSVALIDDDEDFRLLLAAELEGRGHKVEQYPNATSLLENEQLGAVDVVLTDFKLPGLDGLGLCETLQYTHPLLPVVIITAHSSLQSAINAVQNGAADYVVKSCPAAEIEQRLHAAVAAGRRRERRRRQARRVKLASGEAIGGTPYKLVRWLGDGGMGSVFEAEHTAIGRRVAVKILHAELCRSRRMIEAFRNEARASVRVGAPNIIEIYDYIELDDARLMLVMEFLDGESMAKRLSEDTPTPEVSLVVARQICRALGAAHRAGVVHGDVKPANIMLLEREGVPNFAKLLDFGIAYMAHDESLPVRTSGTPAYMAPELIRGHAVDGRLDQYALGCVLYECFTGVTPFGRSAEKALRGHVFDLPRPPRALARFGSDARPRVDALREVEALIMRCLAKAPAHRFPDMAALDVELGRAQCALGFDDPWSSSAPLTVRAEKGEGAIARWLRSLSRGDEEK